MPPKTNHRAAFASDSKFLERLARQGISLAPGQPSLEKAGGGVITEVQGPSPKARNSAAKRLQKVREANKDGRRDRMAYDPQSNALTVLLPGAMLLSHNMMLRVHDAKTTSLKATWRKRIEALKYDWKEVFDQWHAAATFPVIIEEVYITGESNLLDTEAVASANKPVIDAFVTHGFLPDDSPAYVSHPIPYTERGSAPGLLIRIKPSPRPWGLIDDESILHARTMTP